MEVNIMENKIYKADCNDLQEILQLQYLSYQSEAALFGTQDIPPLKQTLGEVNQEYQDGIILKMLDDSGKIIGSIRAKEDNGTVYIGKLMVHPQHRHHGYGIKLLDEIEQYFPNKRYELFTSTRSIANIARYQKMGYKIFKRKVINSDLEFVYLEK
jgi:ribosomal protein S18 acetylase RimI-like enzyme